MRVLRFARALCAISLIGVLLAGGTIAQADVFGRPDSSETRRATIAPHALPLPGFVRDAVRVVVVAQAHLDETLQNDVIRLRPLGPDGYRYGGRGGDGDTWRGLAAFVGLCVAYGVLHALAPGHGKIIVATYFGSRAASARQVASFTLTTALGQSLTAIALVIGALALFEGTANAIMRSAAPLELVSAIAVLGVAALTAVRILRRQECCAPVPLFEAVDDSRRTTDNTDKADTEGTAYLGSKLSAHRRSQSALRAAAFDIAQPRRPGFLALAAALRPCAGALFILLIAARYHAFWLGIVAALAIGLGVAATTFTLGYTLRGGRAAMLKRMAGRRMERLQRNVALTGAILIACFSALQILLIVTGLSMMTPS